MLTLGSKKQVTVGLDIGTRAIKVIAVESADHGGIITSYNVKEIPDGSKASDLKNYVKEAFQEIDLSPEEVNLGFSGPGVIVRFIDLPKMTRDQLAGALNFEAEKYIPFNSNEVVMDFLILGDSSDRGKMRVLLAAAKKDLVESRINLIQELGMFINVLDIDSLAVFNAFELSHPEPDKNTALFHFGHSQANVLVTAEHMPCFIRQIQIGGLDLAKALSKDRKLSVEEAYGQMKDISEKSVQEEKLATTSALFDDIARELQLSFGYFENRYNTKINEVYCSGGMAFEQNILSYIGKKTGFDMKVWSPVQGVQLADHLSREDMDRLGPLLAVSVGLALRK